MFRNVKLFALLLSLLIAGAALASGKGPLASLVAKDGSITNPAKLEAMTSGEGTYVRQNNNLDEIALSEDFEAYSNGQLPTGWTQVDQDNGTCIVTGFGGFSRWIVFSGIPAHSGTKFVANAYNSPPVANNDWLILPQQNLTGTIELSYWAASQDPAYLETFEVRVSTTGNAPADFTNLVSTHVDVPSAYTQYTDNLSEFSGAPFYVAFHYTSVDEFILKLDDVLIEYFTGTPGTISGTVTELLSGTPISGANVEIEGGARTTTDANGDYEFSNVFAGTYTLNFSKNGYEPETIENVVVGDGEDVVVNAQLLFLNLSEQSYTSTANPVNIPDQAFANMTLNIPDDHLITDIDVTVNITHTYVSDCVIWIITPWADTVMLAPDPTGVPAGANMVNCRFDDEAATPFGYAAGGAPYTGSWQPAEDLEALDGFNADGTWTLRVEDTEAADVGTIDEFTVHVTFEGTDADDAPIGLPSSFAFHGAFPNPFNPATSLRFDLANNSNVSLVVFNSLGQEVATLVNGPMTAGSHSISFNATELPSGLYFAQLRAGANVSTQKLVLMK
ncbi:choice-of-anchor J domain-containing protein [bacterium]|nr:choice-of-anchor J domain-containing protein [bacterium]